MKNFGNYWNEWANILLAEYERRFVAMGSKSYGMIPARKIFTAIFLQVKGFPVSTADILLEAIRVIREVEAIHPDKPLIAKEYDAIAMMGHRIGMVENGSDLKQYLLDARPFLKPEGQILFTAAGLHSTNKANRSLQLQQGNLVGPFFNMSRFRADTLKSQAAAANWQCEFVYRQGDGNYAARLSLL